MKMKSLQRKWKTNKYTQTEVTAVTELFFTTSYYVLTFWIEETNTWQRFNLQPQV